MSIEKRFLQSTITADAGGKSGRLVSGYASVYNKVSKDLGGFKEVLAPGAFDEALKNGSSDIIANINHKEDLILARYGKNLKLESNPVGLFFEFEVPKTTYGNDLIENIRSGNISQCSFAFSVESEKWGAIDDNMPLRKISKVKEIFDIAIVTIPAYDDTSLKLRSKKAPGVDPETQKRFDYTLGMDF